MPETRSVFEARKDGEGRRPTRISTLTIVALTEAEINTLITKAIIDHEVALTIAARLVPTTGVGTGSGGTSRSGGTPKTPVVTNSCQYVIDPYKRYFCSRDKIRSTLFNKATEPLNLVSLNLIRIKK